MLRTLSPKHISVRSRSLHFGVVRMENRIGVQLVQGSVRSIAMTSSMTNRVRNGRNALLLVPWPEFSVWPSRATASLLYGRW